MKKLLIVSMFALFVVALAVPSVWAQEGVKFQNGTLKELLAKAGAEGKKLLVVSYTAVSGPSKYMISSVFTQKAVGDYLNANFVNAKFEADKGEGVTIAKSYNVTNYPTFLILDTEGKELGRFTGGGEPDVFIKKITDALAAGQ